MSQANQTTDQWHYAINGQQHGPVPWTELQKLATKGKLARSDRVWRQGYAEWVSAEQVKGLFATDASIGLKNRLFAGFRKATAKAQPDSASLHNFADITSRQAKSKAVGLQKPVSIILLMLRVMFLTAVGTIFGIGVADVIGLLKVATTYLHDSYPNFTWHSILETVFSNTWSQGDLVLLGSTILISGIALMYWYLVGQCSDPKQKWKLRLLCLGSLLLLLAVVVPTYLHMTNLGDRQDTGTPTTPPVAADSPQPTKVHPAKVQDEDEKRTADFFMNYPANVKSSDFIGKKLVVEGDWQLAGLNPAPTNFQRPAPPYRLQLGISANTSPGGYSSLYVIADFSLKHATGSILCLSKETPPPRGQRFKVRGTYLGLIDISGGVGATTDRPGSGLERLHLTDCEVQDAGQVPAVASAAVPPRPTKVVPGNLTKRQFINKMRDIMAYGQLDDSHVHAIFTNNSFQRTFGDPDSNVEWDNIWRLYQYRCIDGSIQLRINVEELIGQTVVEEINQY